MIRKIFGSLLLLVLAAVHWLILVEGPKIDGRMNPVDAHNPYPVSEAARALHETLYVADLHADSLLWRRDVAKRQTRGQVDLPRLRDGGVDFQIFSAVTKSPKGQNFAGNSVDAPDQITLLAVAQAWPLRTYRSIYARAAYQAQRLQAVERDGDNSLVIARRRADMDQPDGTLVGLLLIEGAHPLEGELANVERLFDEGYRAMGLQHFFDNALGGSLHGESRGGLTPFGRQAVTEMWRLGIAVDVAHSSEAVVRDVLAMNAQRPARGPVFISHGGVRGDCAVTDQRNLPDDLLIELARQGGILGVGYFHGAICDITPDGIADAILDAVQLIGVDAVSLGSDFDGTVRTSLDTSELAAITHTLMERGASEADIRRIMGETAREFFTRSLPE